MLSIRLRTLCRPDDKGVYRTAPAKPGLLITTALKTHIHWKQRIYSAPNTCVPLLQLVYSLIAAHTRSGSFQCQSLWIQKLHQLYVLLKYALKLVIECHG